MALTKIDIMVRIETLALDARSRADEADELYRCAYQHAKESGFIDGIDESIMFDTVYWDGRASSLESLLKELKNYENA